MNSQCQSILAETRQASARSCAQDMPQQSDRFRVLWQRRVGKYYHSYLPSAVICIIRFFFCSVSKLLIMVSFFYTIKPAIFTKVCIFYLSIVDIFGWICVYYFHFSSRESQKDVNIFNNSFLTLCFPCLFREERESWIRAKYEQKLFVAPLPPPTPSEGPDITLSGRLLLAVMEHNLPKLLLLLAHCTKEDINAPLSLALSPRSLLALRLPGSALHAACQQADVVMTQLLVWVCF